eukprot:661986-Amphidinium_carterae.1
MAQRPSLVPMAEPSAESQGTATGICSEVQVLLTCKQGSPCMQERLCTNTKVGFSLMQLVRKCKVGLY